MKIYYKVLRREGRKLISYNSFLSASLIGRRVKWGTPADRIFRKRYVPNKPTLPVPGTSLFCFDALESARRFAGPNRLKNDFEVWECVVENPVGLSSGLVTTLYNSAEDYYSFWFSPDRNIIYGTKVPLPPGTILADKITILKKCEVIPCQE